MGKWWERWYPLILSILILIPLTIAFSKMCRTFPSLAPNFEKILDTTITFSSVVEGFLGVLLGILISIKDTKIVKMVFEHIDKNQLMNYLKSALGSGIVLIIVSASLYLKYPFSEIVFYLWCFLTLYFLWSSFRIVTLMFMIIELDKDYGSAERWDLPPNKKEELDKIIPEVNTK